MKTLDSALAALGATFGTPKSGAHLPNVMRALTLGMALAAFAGNPKPSVADGMIIPAYLQLSDAANWNVLQEDAALLKHGTGPRFKDYWVVVNSANNGPFANASDWTLAATRWNPIRANGGQLFGYVHTLGSPTGTTFRPLPDVKRDITAWVNGYPGLGGVWLDEFYPRYEIAGAAGVSATFPNGQALAPTDRTFLNPDGTFNAKQVNPAGGYYSQLTRWIRSTYPRLKIVGNAGGQFYSNQVLYAGLVDVTCSFEQTYAIAANAPTNNWTGLMQQAGTTTNPQLALIHSNSTDLSGAINQSIGRGFHYFYTTDRTLDNNIWGSLPPYFTSEVTSIANHP